jgi:hypothetical protein
MTMTTAAKTKVRKPSGLPARYATVLRGVRKFAAARVKLLEKDVIVIERSARSSAATYLHLAVKELRRFEKELFRLEKMVAPPPGRTRRKAAKKPTAIRAMPKEVAA